MTMKTTTHALIGKNEKAVILVAPPEIEWPTLYVNDFKDCCGPGHGLIEQLVPEHFLRLRISAACDVHDKMWGLCEPTWADFHVTNDVFQVNLSAIINSYGGPLKYFRLMLAIKYLFFVDMGAKAKLFWKYKNG